MSGFCFEFFFDLGLFEVGCWMVDCKENLISFDFCIRAMQVIYVNRFSPPSRKHAVNEIMVEYLPVVSPLTNQKETAVHFAKRVQRQASKGSRFPWRVPLY